MSPEFPVRPAASTGAVRCALQWVATVCVILVFLAACGGDGGTRPAAVASVALTMPAASALVAGTSHQLAAATLDAGGTALTGRTVAWTTSNGAVATVSATGVLQALMPGAVTITATSEGRVATATITVLPVPIATVAVTPATPTAVEGTSVQLAAAALDAQGRTLPGRSVTWSSTNAAVATVDETGRVTAVGVGTATILATAEGVTGSATITVTPRPVASVTVAPLTAELRTGRTQQFVATLRDAAGVLITGRAVVWGTSDASVATIDAATGLLTAVGAGSAVVTARIEGREGTAAVTVTVATAPTITGIAPAVLVPGASATITGTGFNANFAFNFVTIGGATATVQSGSETALVVTVPCVSSGDVPVRASNDGANSAAVSHPLAVPQRPLGVGESVVLTSSEASRCNELPATGGPARYLVTVFSAALSQNVLFSYELGGNVGGTAPPAPMTAVRSAGALRTPVAAEPEDRLLAARDAAHWRMLERNRADYARLRALAAAMPPQVRTHREAAPPPAAGDMRTIYFTFSAGCADTTRQIRARAIFVGARGVIWEDSANALQSSASATLAGYYDRMGQVYDRDQHETIRKYFADPLVRDDVTDDDDRVHMVFTQRLNGTGAAAYVTSCDQFSRSVSGNAGSNFGQFFYGTVPTTASLNPNSTASPDGWFAFMTRTVVHEVKHIASLSARVANNAPVFEQSWLEEGSARMAEEMWVRDSLHRTPWKSNTGWGSAATNGVYCDFHLTDATCNALDPLRRPTWGMRRQFNEVRPKMLEPWNWSPYGDGTGQGGAVFYNTTWSLLRYAIDRYATSEETFLRALTNSMTNGMANLTAVAGTTRDQLVGGWGMALYADDYPGMPTTNGDLQFRTWNLRSIYAGLNASPAWAAAWSTPYVLESLAPRLAFGSFFNPGHAVRGGAHEFWDLSGTAAGAQLLRLDGAGSTTLPPDARLAIARLQ